MGAAAGLRVHSGWAACTVVAASGGAIEVIERRILHVIDPAMKGAKQPYHYIESLPLETARGHLDRCAALSGGMALDALTALVRDLAARGHALERVAVLQASGRPLPELEKILASHALIHTAEGEFFRDIFRNACRALQLAVANIREREVVEVKALRRPDSPPWAQDQKFAAFAACGVLASR